MDADRQWVQTGPWDTRYHAPALVREVTTALAGAVRVLDATLGGGGHTAALVAGGAHVDGVDRDPEAVAAGRERLSDQIRAGQVRLFVANFAALDLVPDLVGARFDGVLLDLGVSSHQLDDPGRGFSFRRGAALDMRMSRAPASSDARDEPMNDTAATLLNTAPEAELTIVFRDFADEPRAARLARTIVYRRERQAFGTSDDLVDAIRAVLGARSGPPDFARIFQALRIAVNDEVGALRAALPMLRDRLTGGGRLAIISYHSGEDRLVKTTFREWSLACHCPPRQPFCTCGGHALGKLVTRRPMTAQADEVALNPRSRSAKLRVWERVP
jgi:16S rRNA (cytosine1402-N4)-methyltransferase